MCLMCLFSMLLKKSGGKNLMTGTLNHVCDLGFPQRAECFSRKRTEDGCYSLKRLPQKKLNLILALSVCVRACVWAAGHKDYRAGVYFQMSILQSHRLFWTSMCAILELKVRPFHLYMCKFFYSHKNNFLQQFSV